MVSLNSRPLSGTSSHYLHSSGGASGAASNSNSSGNAGGSFRMLGRRKMSKFRFRIMIFLYLAMGCIIPYFVMEHAEEEKLYQQERRLQQQHQEQGQELSEVRPQARNGEGVGGVQGALAGAFGEQIRLLGHGEPLRIQHAQQKQILETLNELYDKQRQQAKLHRIKSVKSYENRVNRAVEAAKAWVVKKLPPEHQILDESRIPGTNLDSSQKTRRFRRLMSEALDKGREWNKKKHGERDRVVAIDRPPFPEAGKYHWEPALPAAPQAGEGQGSEATTTAGGWHVARIQPEEFCRLLGPRHIVLVGDLIHWQLHDSIMYNMFDNPQACYGDLACHMGVGHPLCPLPNDVCLKFVRTDDSKSFQTHKHRINETKTQDPVEMPWLKDMRLKDTVILGATHQPMKDKMFQRLLTDTVTKIRRARPEALIIYRNNPVGHPECPSKGNGLNSNKLQRQQRDDQQQQQAFKAADGTISGQQQQQRVLESTVKVPISHNSSTFGAPARLFERDIPLVEMLDYPLNWAHYDRQNRVAKAIIKASGGVYWNAATMTNMRPDGHVGGQDCLSYRRPGPTDEWAVSLFNLLKTIEVVEQEG
ncbi:hypothetical protein BGX33_009389 [Mortierella sp. NVP41]|nr:hypothetical protein BGX33_009389 [Mortierella sp. NVP41]